MIIPSASYGKRSLVFESVVVSRLVTLIVFEDSSQTAFSIESDDENDVSEGSHGYRTVHAVRLNGSGEDVENWDASGVAAAAVVGEIA